MNTEEKKRVLQELRAKYDETFAKGFSLSDNVFREELRSQILGCERELAEAQGQEFAREWSWPGGMGVVDEVVICYQRKAYLIYPVYGNQKQGQVSVVEFLACQSVKYGDPNDEVMDGHPLYGFGIEHSGAYVVVNSRWIRELEKINRNHRLYDPLFWKTLKHYLLFFKERTFECVAQDVRSRVIDGNVGDILNKIKSDFLWRK